MCGMILELVELQLGVKGQKVPVTRCEQEDMKESTREFWSHPRNTFRKRAPLLSWLVPPDAFLHCTTRIVWVWLPPGSLPGCSQWFPVSHIAGSSQYEITQLHVSISLKTEPVRGRTGAFYL